MSENILVWFINKYGELEIREREKLKRRQRREQMLEGSSGIHKSLANLGLYLKNLILDSICIFIPFSILSISFLLIAFLITAICFINTIRITLKF